MKKAHNIKYYELVLYKENSPAISSVRVLTTMEQVMGIEPALSAWKNFCIGMILSY